MREKFMKNILLTALTVLFVLAAAALSADQAVQAEETTDTITGTCGESAVWSYKNGVLTISGSGAMTSRNDDSLFPAWKSCGQITEVIVEEGITEVGSLSRLTVLEKVTLPQSLTKIARFAFAYCANLKEISIPANVTELDNGCFSKCTSLTKIILPAHLTTLSDSCFSGCTSLNSITLPDSLTELGHNSFSDCTSLTEITIPDGITKLDYNCFYNCTSLSKITIPESVTLLGSYCFFGCTSLREFTIPSGVTTLGESCFASCTSLSKVTFPASLTRISSYCFYNCSGFKEFTIPDTVTSLDQYSFNNCTNLSKITIPANVTELGAGCFAGCTSLTEAVISTGTTSLSERCFYNCTSLTEISLPDNMAKLDDSCFYNCTALRSMYLPDSLTDIGSMAFSYCSALQDVSLGNSLKILGENAFSYCTSLTEITIPASLQTFGSSPFNGCASLSSVVYNASNAKLAANSESGLLGHAGNTEHLITLTLGNTVKILPDYFLSISGYVTEVKGGVSLTSIGKYAFYHCSSLTSITLPDAVTELPNYAFYKCSSLKNIYMPKNLTAIGNGAFYNCDSLQSVALPKGLESIGEYAFHQCSALTSVTLPDTVTEIKDYAFDNCTALEAFHFSQAVTSIPTYAFNKCTKLSSVTLPESLTEIEFGAFYSCSSLKTIQLPGNLQSIGSLAFAYSGLTSVVIPDSVTNVGNSIFTSCQNLEAITISENVAEIPSSICRDCTSLSSVTHSSNLVKIDQNAFYNCEALACINFPDTLQDIGDYAFYNCSSLPGVQLTDALTTIGKEAFKGCTALTELTIPQNVQSIGEYAFSNCPLKSIIYQAAACTSGQYAFRECGAANLSAVITDNVTTLPDGLFERCSNLKSVTFACNPEKLGKRLFVSCSSLTSVQLPSTLTEIPENMFDSCENLAEIELPATLASIGDYAFSYCSSLTEIKFPKTLTSIGNYAFNRCTNLADAVLGKSIQSLGRLCFSYTALPTEIQNGMQIYCGWILEYNDTKAASLDIPEGIHGISGYAFYWQRALTSVSLPDSLCYISDYAFRDCSKLTSVTGGANVTQIGASSFENTPWATDSDYAMMGNCLIRCNLKEEEITLPDDVTKIAPAAFSGNKTIKRVHLPDSLTEIPANAFSGCQNLTEISLPPSLKTIGETAFYQTGLTSIELPEGLTQIGYLSFSECKSLTEIVIPASLTQIGSSAFSGSSLTSIIFAGTGELSLLEASLRYGAHAFSGIPSCEDTILSWYSNRHFSLESKNGSSRLSMIARLMARNQIQSGEVKSLKDAYDWICAHCGYTFDVGYHYSFADGPFFYGIASCQGVALGMRAFLDELGLPNFILFGTVNGAYGRRSHAWNQVYVGSWYHMDATDTKKGDYSTYMMDGRNMDNYTWDKETASTSQDRVLNAYIPRQDNVIQPLTFTLQEDGTYWVTDCYLYHRGGIEIPSTYQGKPVTGIGDNAFLKCYWLTNIIIPEGIQTVGNGAFAGCIALEKLVFPSTLEELGSDAFVQCLLLNEVDLSATSIPEVSRYSFADTASLHVLRLPASASVSDIFSWRPIINSLSGEIKLHVYGYTGSAAEDFAKNEGYDFTSIGTVLEQTITGVEESYTIYDGSNGADILATASAGGTLTYSSADESIAIISKDGHIRPNGIGETEITITADRAGQYGRVSVTAKVVVIPRLTQEITGIEDSYSMYAGSEGIVLTAASTGGGTLTYTSKNISVARTDANGHITPVNVGTAEIEIEASATETYAKATRTIQITVLQKLDLAVLKPDITLSSAVYTYTGDIFKPTVTVILAEQIMEYDKDYTLKYPESKNPGKYQVQITGKGIYSGTITADYEILKRQITITGLQSSYIGTVGESLKLHPGTERKCLYVSSDETIAYASDESQTLYFRSPGTVEFTAIITETTTDKDARFTFTVTVQKKDDGSGEGSSSGNSGSGSSNSDSSGSGGNNTDQSNSPVSNGNQTDSKITRLSQPSLKTPAITAKGITVKWNSVPNASSYTIYRKTSGTWERIASVSGGTKTSYTDKTTANGILYSYTVQACYGSIKSSYNTTGKQLLYLKAPTLSSVKKVSAKKASVTWKKNKKASGYQIQCAASPTFKGAKTTRVSSSKKTSAISKPAKKKTCYIRIRAYKKAAGKTWYSAYSQVKQVKP